jgi:hypothetical protein
MEKGKIGAGGQLPMGPDSPMDTDALQQMLARGPGGVESEVRPSIPDMPKMQKVEPRPAPIPEAEPQKEVGFEPGKTGDEASLKKEKQLRDLCILPPKGEQEKLKAKFGELRVVPIPFSRPDDQVKAYVLRPLTRAQWRRAEETALKVAEAKGGLSAGHIQELVAERIVAQSVVWPQLPGGPLEGLKAGLIPTLHGIVQKISWFFDPDALMDATFVL